MGKVRKDWGFYDVRADFATHDLVCGDHDKDLVCRLGVGRSVT